MTASRIGVLFVCHANICRSPLAEGVFTNLVRARGLEDRFVIDSAGCWADGGHSPHPFSIEIADKHGIDLRGLRSRGIEPEDLHRFDHILAMDRGNLADLERLRRISLGASLGAFGPVQGGKARIRLFRHVVDPKAQGAAADVADPVRLGIDAYASTYALLVAASEALLDEVLR
jgi:protein-tyrosine phosphatase